MNIFSTVINILIAALPIIFAITLHEAAHGKAAKWCGDPTAHQMGRITANPIRHIDLIGTIIVPIVLMLLSGATNGATPIFGWAKPVPVDVSRLRNPLRDQFWVASAGPFSNLLMLMAWWAIYAMVQLLGEGIIREVLSAMAITGVFANASLFLLNMLPILPLDGGRIVMSLLPRRYVGTYIQSERFGFAILLFLLFTHSLDFIFNPTMNWLLTFFNIR